jgi:hypothetical protein
MQCVQALVDCIQLRHLRKSGALKLRKFEPASVMNEIVFELLPTSNKSFVFFFASEPGSTNIDRRIHPGGDIFYDSDCN